MGMDSRAPQGFVYISQYLCNVMYVHIFASRCYQPTSPTIHHHVNERRRAVKYDPTAFLVIALRMVADARFARFVFFVSFWAPFFVLGDRLLGLIRLRGGSEHPHPSIVSCFQTAFQVILLWNVVLNVTPQSKYWQNLFRKCPLAARFSWSNSVKFLQTFASL
jgi:hypothetical protein